MNSPICGWCGGEIPCNCGYNREGTDKPNWEKIEEVFPSGLPSCGMTDGRLLGGSSKDNPQGGTIYLGKERHQL